MTCMSYARAVSESLPSGPDPETITEYITSRFPDVDVVSIEGMRFFSLDPEKHWPKFRDPRLVGRFRSGVRSVPSWRIPAQHGRRPPDADRFAAAEPSPDYTALDRVLPHPDYAKQLWVAILNPSESTFGEIVIPLLDEAHQRLAAQRARHTRGA